MRMTHTQVDGLPLIVLAVFAYTLPAILAICRWRYLGHEQVTRIAAMNIFLGWMIWFWIWAMYLATRETYIERIENPKRRIY